MRKASKSASGRHAWVVVLLMLIGCAPELGDACRQNTDCSVQGDRFCDISPPGGYCTIADCLEGSCQGEGYCIRFEPDQLRLASSFCMAKCKRGCRDGYRCVTVDDLNAERCGVAPSERERLLALEDPAGEDALALEDLERCLAATPRLAEVLDNRPDAKFCTQELPEALVREE